ncbi:MAG: phosphatidylethanolamine N-methyltransferase family protein [Acidobacteria bacterium]|nr:phosphatidylethanolamine N-methyltransferase family protein [Acidobacteriota bacterium]
MKPTGSVAAIFERQWLHILFLVIALPVLWLMAMNCGCFHRGELWGVSTWNWFWIAIEIPILHQVFVWFCWRTELHRGLLSRLFGEHAFAIYAAVFAILLLGRLLVVTALAIASQETLPVNQNLLKVAAVAVATPVVYLVYSVIRYFGILRAFGKDHFDRSYRSRPLVRRGIFRLTSNGMYTFGMLILYVPALWLASRPALVAAVFAHLYIWVHFVTTELPDMRRIYRDPPPP